VLAHQFAEFLFAARFLPLFAFDQKAEKVSPHVFRNFWLCANYQWVSVPPMLPTSVTALPEPSLSSLPLSRQPLYPFTGCGRALQACRTVRA